MLAYLYNIRFILVDVDLAGRQITPKDIENIKGRRGIKNYSDFQIQVQKLCRTWYLTRNTTIKSKCALQFCSSFTALISRLPLSF